MSDTKTIEQLERELNEANEKSDNLMKLVGWSDGKLDVEELLNERDKLRAELDKSRSENLTVRAVAGDKYPDALLLKEVYELRAELEKVRGIAKDLAQELTDNLAPEIQSPALERFTELEKSK